MVHEKSEGFDTIGAGLQLSPNATRVLGKLGLERFLDAACTRPDTLNIHNGRTGYKLATIRLGDHVQRRFGAPYLLAHRADLQSILFERCQNDPRINIRFSSQVIEMAPHARGVTATYREGGQDHERNASALVVADGVWSRLRTRVLQLEAPNYSGKIAWRAMIPADQVKSDTLLANTHVWFGPKSHVVTYPLRSGQSVNVVVITQGPEASEGDRLEISASELLTRFNKWKGDFLPLLETKARWTGWPIFEMAGPRPMKLGTIALVGDAAHAMLPFAAQGAAMAIEDAAVLGKMFETHDTPIDAMDAFEKARLARVKRMMKTARKNGRIYHMSGIPSEFRDLGMWMMPTALMEARQNWIYSWKV